MAKDTTKVSRDNYDFSGWATKANILCSDGRTIMKDAFKDQDNARVPMVYMHNHSSIDQILGHCLLENRPEGVYMYGLFNDSPNGIAGKEAVRHGDITGLSIWANKLAQKAGQVLHGMIQEVSLVLRGANSGALIDNVLCHGDDESCVMNILPVFYQRQLGENGEEVLVHADYGEEAEDQAYISCIDPNEIKMAHGCDEEDDETCEKKDKAAPAKSNIKALYNSAIAKWTPEEKTLYTSTVAGIRQLANNGTIDASDKETPEGSKLQAQFDAMMKKLTEEEADVMYSILGAAQAEAQNNTEKEKTMAHSEKNLFETAMAKLDESEQHNILDLLNALEHPNELEHADGDDIEDKIAAFGEAAAKFTDEERDYFNLLIDHLAEKASAETNISHSENNEEGENTTMNHVFDSRENDTVLSHADQIRFLDEATRRAFTKNGSGVVHFADVVRNLAMDGNHENVLRHCFGDDYANNDEYLAHGIDNVSTLFPDAKELYPTPETVNNPDDWTAHVLANVGRTPFTRFKTTFATIEYETARSKGYITGNMKKEQWVEIRKREVSPTTVYAKEHLDKDNIDDITSFDVVAWIKQTMMVKLKEELARAILLGDGRDSEDEDKVDATKIKPIYTDSEPFVINKLLTVDDSLTDSQVAVSFIETVIKSRDDYRGKKTPVLYVAKGVITKCLLIKDTLGHYIYETVQQLKDKLCVSDIIEVYEMNECTRVIDGHTRFLQGIMTNLGEAYKLGTQKGGEIESFNFFDIDYNRYKYLDETRCSGMLVKWNNAIVFETVYGLVAAITATAGTTTRYGKLVSAIQRNAFVQDDFISGELIYQSEAWTAAGFDEGYYLATDVTANEGATIKCLNECTGNEVTVSDGYVVSKIDFTLPNFAKKHLIFTITKSGEPTLVKKFKLSGLRPVNA